MRIQGMRIQGMPMEVIEARGEVSSTVPGGPNDTNMSSQVTRHAKKSSLQALHVGECGCREGTLNAIILGTWEFLALAHTL
jgi:hypothetical protein